MVTLGLFSIPGKADTRVLVYSISPRFLYVNIVWDVLIYSPEKLKWTDMMFQVQCMNQVLTGSDRKEHRGWSFNDCTEGQPASLVARCGNCGITVSNWICLVSDVMVGMGFTRDEINDSLVSQKYNEITATYLLLGRKNEVSETTWCVCLFVSSLSVIV